jgi:GNAT superfamily N-acetyltransferase
MDIERAVLLFLKAYTHLQAVTTGAELGEIGALPCIHFHSGLDDAARDEVILTGLGVEQAARRLRDAAPGLPHWLTVFSPDPALELAAARRLGYQLQAGEFLMARELSGGGPGGQAGLPEQVDSEGLASGCILRRATRARDIAGINAARAAALFHPDQLDDPLLEILLVEKQERVLAWGAGLRVEPDVVYITNMYTRPEHRREGLAGAVLERLLSRAAARGARESFLVSSLSGRGLYQRMGYRLLCDCLVLKWIP